MTLQLFLFEETWDVFFVGGNFPSNKIHEKNLEQDDLFLTSLRAHICCFSVNGLFCVVDFRVVVFFWEAKF